MYKKRPYELLHHGADRNYFSISSLKVYANCNRGYFLKYHGKIKETTRPNYFQFGGAIHRGLEVWSMTRDLKKAEVAFVKEFKKDINKVTAFGKIMTAEEIKNAITDGKTIMYLWSKQGYSFKPRLVEQTYLVPVRHPKTGEELPIPLMVKMDMIDMRDIIADYKVVASKMKEIDPYQKTAYWIAFREMFGRAPKLFMNCPIVKAKVMPKIQQPLQETVSVEEEIRFFDYAKEILEGIKSGNFKSTHKYAHQCSFATGIPVLCKQ